MKITREESIRADEWYQNAKLRSDIRADMHSFIEGMRAALPQANVIKAVCDFCDDTYRVQQHNVCESCRKICGD